MMRKEVSDTLLNGIVLSIFGAVVLMCSGLVGFYRTLLQFRLIPTRLWNNNPMVIGLIATAIAVILIMMVARWLKELWGQAATAIKQTEIDRPRIIFALMVAFAVFCFGAAIFMAYFKR